MALDSSIKTAIEGSITIADGAALTHTLEFDTGDFSIGPIRETLNESVPVERRGKFLDLVHGARVYPSGKFTVYLNQFTDATADLLTDMVARSGVWAAATSTLGANARKATYNITFAVEATDLGGGADLTFTLHDCELTIDSITEGIPSTISASFVVYGEITGDIAADEVA